MFEASFSIGAIDSTMTIAGFSSRGNVTSNGSGIMKPNVAAPGVDVYSSIPGGGYAYYSGTSMAGPHTVGLVALVICANPLLAGETDAIENIIEGTAHAVTTAEGCGGDGNTNVPNNTYGWGIIDALAAVQEAMVFTANDLVSSESGIHIFPNVTTNFMFVNFEPPVNDASLKLFTISGQQISTLKFSAEENTIQLSALPSGIYLYQAGCNGKTVSGKIVKQ
jgi:subtilisin family serine protease